jgi:hypothetical protein
MTPMVTILTISIYSPKTIPELVSFEQASYSAEKFSAKEVLEERI